MLDIGWSELLLIGIVALIVIGPKDLPHLFHSLGRITARARSMAREFSSAMEDAAKSAGLDEAGNALRDVKSLTSKKALGLDALERAADRFEKWEPKAPSRSTQAVPDPGATGPEPGDGPNPAGSPSDSPAASGSGPEAAPAASIAADDHIPGQRRLHAVRRSDTKDR
ncbi:Sec-independent protein translocase protein TatB [Paracoccus denitrificans]|jgi:sec-independent protein translocase protein TatB|uniref:Twin-arginine translocation protein, TatB subunit n=1 Tax=Paracoccus denitrificans (strain Pd 1222) TaxID=318586 RepID=A1B0H5_PARDP|nr:Sec-independent protein translocase protein TatB [Paracoccus denitrificans]ABL69019.1 twin-arginine translocation protein, TatB subunit [Paracoccus denitrificans PD1222]MBB4625256.1 sec-independent protein translocase protein TatB [Paracoccus denitrificans]MCU7428082.1 Sec-independent protein translocase protein TatB [Paracoccus denitrificans]QAR27054.1 twin-arginine translocase subunit TatB [Paracoccus denitrificans]UPV96016.1 Sec-independent protein translocase protein TatB [Paracoccus de